jgi:hypothetical protein
MSAEIRNSKRSSTESSAVHKRFAYGDALAGMASAKPLHLQGLRVQNLYTDRDTYRDTYRECKISTTCSYERAPLGVPRERAERAQNRFRRSLVLYN